MVALAIGMGIRHHVRPSSIYAAFDDFNRTIAITGGWGTSESGHAWETSSNTYMGVANGAAFVEPGAINSVTGCRLGYTAGGDQEILATVNQKVAGTALGARVRIRSQASGAYPSTYEVGWFQGSAAWGSEGGGLTFTTFAPPQGNFIDNDTWLIRVRCTGSSPVRLQARVWKFGTTEPVVWQVDRSDSTGSLLTGGRPGFVVEWANASGGAASGAYLQQFLVTNLGGAPIVPTTIDPGAPSGTDDTTAWQNAVNNAPAGGVIDGQNRSYIVTTVNLKSNITIQNANFLTKAGSTDLVSPMTIGVRNNPQVISNITIKNVHIDGNRSNQTSVGSGGFGEDGGRSGFRIIGHVTDVLIQDCSALHCATDGIEIYSGPGPTRGTTPATVPIILRITVRNCQFNNNRRLGGSGDSMQDCTFDTCTFNNNGLDETNSAGTAPRQGFDLEFYDINSRSQNLTWLNCQFMGNGAQGYVALDPHSDAVGWVQSTGLFFTGCTFQANSGSACDLTSSIANTLGPKIFSNVQFSNCAMTSPQGYVFRACTNITMTGGSCSTTNTTAGLLDATTNVTAQRATALGGENFSLANGSTVTYT